MGAISFDDLMPPRKELWGSLPNGLNVYLVDGERIRDQVDSDFVAYGSHTLESYIPEGEIWVDDNVEPGEVEYLAFNALKEESYRRYFDDPSTVNSTDIDADEQDIVLVAPLPDFGPIKVWIVDGNEVRARFNPDFRMAGNGSAYPFIPPDAVWIDNVVSDTERPPILLHEVAEMLDMLEGSPYIRAHRRVTVEVEAVVRRDPGQLEEIVAEQTERAWRIIGGEPGLSETDQAIVATLKAAGLYDSLAELVGKNQPAAGDVHASTALGNEDEGSPKKRKAQLFSAVAAPSKGSIAKRAPALFFDVALAATKRVFGKVEGEPGPCCCDTTPETCPQHSAKALAAAANKRAAPRSLKPIDEKNSHSPFSYDPQAMDKLKPEHVQQFLGALTKPDELEETRTVQLNGLHATQENVQHDKVEGIKGAMEAGSYERPNPPVVARWAGKNYIIDGHHDLAARWLNGEHSAEVKYVALGKDKPAAEPTTKISRAATSPGAGDPAGAEAEAEWSIRIKVDKAYTEKREDQRVIFGWASIAERDGQIIIDKQGDMIPPAELEQAVYDYVRTSREHDNMHTERVTGDLVESMVYTKEKQQTLGIHGLLKDERGRVLDTAWWGGWYVGDGETWAAFKRGELPELSIGGSSMRVPV